jgi:hypothetical protein
VDIGSFPASAKEQCRCCNVFCQRAEREIAYFVQSVSPGDVTRSSTPGDTERIFDRFRDMHKEVKTLAQRIAGRNIVEKL